MTTQTTSRGRPVELNLPTIRKGKVRQVYDLPAESSGASQSGGEGGRVLMVASDRISAFDVVLPTPIPGKGVTLTKIASWWFDWITQRGLVETHLLSTDAADIPAEAIPAGGRDWLEGRITIGRKCRVIPVECVVRGYLEGSGWKDYQRTGQVCGHRLPAGLRQCEKLPEPIFTPATKAETGHDENITFEQAAEIVGLEVIGALRDLSLKIYTEAAAYALERGIIIADTKFEFGFPVDGQGGPGGAVSGRVWNQPILIDEALTPDSSRFWPAASYQPGRSQPSFDKQFVREYLTGLVDRGEWDKTDPGPILPKEVVSGTIARYEEAYERLCGPAA